jgi:hypothetical protein
MTKGSAFFSFDHMIDGQPARSYVVRKTEPTILSSRGSKNRHELLNPQWKDATMEVLQGIMRKGCESGTHNREGEEYGVIRSGKLQLILPKKRLTFRGSGASLLGYSRPKMKGGTLTTSRGP